MYVLQKYKKKLIPQKNFFLRIFRRHFYPWLTLIMDALWEGSVLTINKQYWAKFLGIIFCHPRISVFYQTIYHSVLFFNISWFLNIIFCSYSTLPPFWPLPPSSSHMLPLDILYAYNWIFPLNSYFQFFIVAIWFRRP